MRLLGGVLAKSPAMTPVCHKALGFVLVHPSQFMIRLCAGYRASDRTTKEAAVLCEEHGLLLRIQVFLGETYGRQDVDLQSALFSGFACGRFFGRFPGLDATARKEGAATDPHHRHTLLRVAHNHVSARARLVIPIGQSLAKYWDGIRVHIASICVP